MVLFFFATCLPAVLIATAAILAGPWPIVAVFSLSVLVVGLDQFTVWVASPSPEDDRRSADFLSLCLAVIHFGLIPLVVWALAGDTLSTFDKLCVFVASMIFFGQIGLANAHELIHRRKLARFQLGMWIYISLLFGHHVSAHLLIHHRFVGTRDDPCTSRLGENYYRFLIRALFGTVRTGYQAEARRLRHVQRSAFENPFWVYLIGSIGFIVLAFSVGGVVGVLWFVAISIFVQQQILLCDYVQHYGLERKMRVNGHLEPISDRHSWKAPHWFPADMMSNARRHSDHHARPFRPYPLLAKPSAGPMLPRSLPVMAFLALFPPIWRRVMDRRAQHWKDIAAP
jgi:alkane 1-monooxygenase